MERQTCNGLAIGFAVNATAELAGAFIVSIGIQPATSHEPSPRRVSEVLVLTEPIWAICPQQHSAQSLLTNTRIGLGGRTMTN